MNKLRTLERRSKPSLFIVRLREKTCDKRATDHD